VWLPGSGVLWLLVAHETDPTVIGRLLMLWIKKRTKEVIRLR
jgi:hypothetical protein